MRIRILGTWFIPVLSLSSLVFSFSKLCSAEPTQDFQVRVEVSPVWQTVNQVQIPATGGSRFEFTSLGQGPAWNYRFDAAWRIGENSEIRALFAPLSLSVKGSLGGDVSFQNSLFSGSSTETEGLYRFNSYRLTYRYRIVRDEKFQLWLGATGKIRDAEIRLTQGSQSASSTNTGFVPLLHLLSTYRFSDDFRVILEADALAAPQGRAEDIGLLLALRLHPQAEGLLGYRTVEGGSNGGGNVYSFAWLHYAVFGVSVNF